MRHHELGRATPSPSYATLSLDDNPSRKERKKYHWRNYDGKEIQKKNIIFIGTAFYLFANISKGIELALISFNT